MKANEQRQRYGNFQFCIDLGLDADQTAISDHQNLAELGNEIIGLFNQHDIAATWATSLCMSGRVADAISKSPLEHELAILGRSDWVGSNVRRAVVAESLNDFLRESRNLNQPLSSVVLRDSDVDSHHELFVRNGINVVRRPVKGEHAISRRVTRDPVVTRRGAWYVAATAEFPTIGSIISRFDVGFRAKKVLKRSIGRRAAEHVAISATDIMANPKSMNALVQIVRHAARLQSADRIRCETLRQSVARMQPSGVTVTPQRSILRPAA